MSVKQCYEFKNKWDNCSNRIFIKYYNSSDNKSYFLEMNDCFKFYKKYIECIKKK